MTKAEELAEAILTAAGSALRHYTPETKRRIIDAATKEYQSIRSKAYWDGSKGRSE